jgi:hypothetical protein
VLEAADQRAEVEPWAVRSETGSWLQLTFRPRETFVTNINDNLPHSRPNRLTLVVALALILGVGAIVFWPQISAFVHLQQIKEALGL